VFPGLSIQVQTTPVMKQLFFFTRALMPLSGPPSPIVPRFSSPPPQATPCLLSRIEGLLVPACPSLRLRVPSYIKANFLCDFGKNRPFDAHRHARKPVQSSFASSFFCDFLTAAFQVSFLPGRRITALLSALRVFPFVHNIGRPTSKHAFHFSFPKIATPEKVFLSLCFDTR